MRDGPPLSLALALALIACRSHHAATRDDAPRPRDAAADATTVWPELATFPQIDPVKIVALPVRQDVPRFDVGGPAIIADVAVVASSQFGFIAVDYRRGQIAWSKPAGSRVAPPLAQAGSVILIGECLNAPAVPDLLLGCARIVTPTGADQGYVAIHGPARDLAPFAAAGGPQRLWSAGDHAVRWCRGDTAVVIDLLTGLARSAAAADPPLVVHYKDRTWDIAQTDDGIIAAREHGHSAWQTKRAYTAVLGAVYLPGQSPMVRVSNAGAFGGHAEMNLMDIDATGSMHGQVAFPVPGIGLLGHAIDSIGDVAIAVRLDRSLDRDFIVGYAANALLMWVYALPRMQRLDPVGVAVAPDAVVVFHDGDTVTVLPELSAPPTAPGAARAPLENATP